MHHTYYTFKLTFKNETNVISVLIEKLSFMDIYVIYDGCIYIYIPMCILNSFYIFNGMDVINMTPGPPFTNMG